MTENPFENRQSTIESLASPAELDPRIEEIRKLYDAEYASVYDQNYLLGKGSRECTEFEMQVIQGILRPGDKWLDVACGTGYLLSRFPDVSRAGIDISPAMLDTARRANPNAAFFEHDFRKPKPEWNDQWDVISSTWYAYCYAENFQQVSHFIANLAAWTKNEGTVFLPVCDPNVLCKTQIPRNPPADSDDGSLKIQGIVWEWTDVPSRKKHTNMIAPHLDWMKDEFGKYFQKVELLQYPKFQEDLMASRSAIIAKNRK